MLKYLVQSTEQLLTVMILAGAATGYVRGRYADKHMRIFRWTIFAGLILSACMTWFKVMTNKVDTGIWNLRIYSVTFAAFVLFLLSKVLQNKIGKLIPVLMLAVYTAMLLIYFLPFFMEMPHAVMLAEKTIWSTSAICKMIGIFGGFLLTFVAGIAVYRSTAVVSEMQSLLFIIVIALINTAQQLAASFGILLAKRIIKTNHTLFVISKYASNYSFFFCAAIMFCAAILMVLIWIQSLTEKEPYSNPAERRKIIAKWRSRRKFALTAVVCFILSAWIMTGAKAYANRKVELSPIEDAKIENGYVVVPFEQVNDGHLHRFGYTTEKGITIRFIVIQKPGSSAYGIGLDACDICGETGYYEKEGQVVCNLCDVVMNINTIGFKGGCNPIVIDYEIQNGSILVPVEGLIEHESTFK